MRIIKKEGEEVVYGNDVGLSRQVEMANEQNFVQLGRMVQIGLGWNEETTK